MKIFSRLGTIIVLVLLVMPMLLGAGNPAASAAGKPPTATPSGPTATPSGPTATPSGSSEYTVTVNSTSYGTTETSIGANEACSRFNISDIVDLGLKNYRFYAGMERVEPADDDGTFGSPDIPSIKANPNIIPWTVWDSYFNRSDAYWWSDGCVSAGTPGATSLHDMMSQLTANGISPVIVLRNVENQNPTWAWQNLNPPTTQAAKNEWWQYVFAWVYTANVRYGLNVDDWEVLNEPDKGGTQGGWGGTKADYVTLLIDTTDAINYVYSTYLGNRPHRIYAPGVSGPGSGQTTWITYTLQNADSSFNVLDWHRYGDPKGNAQTLNNWIDQYNPDGVHEPLMLSEWGSYSGGFGTLSSAMTYASQLMHHSLAAPYNIARSSIFSMYDWTPAVTGLMGGNGTPHEDYYAFRLMTRGLQNAKTAYPVAIIPSTTSIEPFVAKDPTTGTIYIELINSTAQSHTVTIDLTALTTSGTVTFREYSATKKDVVIGTGSVVNGKINITLPANSITQVIK